MKKTSLLFLLLLFIITSCVDEHLKSFDKIVVNETSFVIEEAFPDLPYELIKINDELTLKKIDSLYILGGDVMLTQQQVDYLMSMGSNPNLRSTALTKFQDYWSYGTVHYSFENNFNNVANVNAAMATWEANTGLRFRQRTNQKDYILFKNSINSNSSSLGHVGGAQIIYLANNSSFGNALHEIGHTVGLLHEQARSDRDQFVTVHWNNIESDKQHNFKTFIESNTSAMNVGVFDFGSVMMYPSFTGFEINPSLPSMTRRDGTTFAAQRNGLSQGDINAGRLLYGPPYAKIESTVTYDYSESYGITDITELDFDNIIHFYSDREYKNRTIVDTPRRIIIRLTSERLENGRVVVYSNNDFIYTIPTGTNMQPLGTTEFRAMYEMGNIARWSNSYYTIIGACH